ncbi:hypothetical protein [Dissulfuribacter thermophilus]|nr:hypothetical protein [Dissulfuribacter thermophilus]
MTKNIVIALSIALLACPSITQASARGMQISKKNIFLPPDERAKEDSAGGALVPEDKFLERYLLYGVIKAGDYGVAILKVNPKKKREVPTEIRDKKLIKLRPGETLDGYKLVALNDGIALFEKAGKIIRIDTFDIDKKPERQTKISVAQATPRAVPAAPKIKPQTPKIPHFSGTNRVRNNAKVTTNNGPSRHVAQPQAKPPVKKPVPPSAPKPPIPAQTPANNPFLRALQRARQNPGTATPTTPGTNPFLQMLKKK